MQGKQPSSLRTRRYRWRYMWLKFRSILAAMEQQDDLSRLVTWARRKKLPGPLRHYRALLDDAEQRLLFEHIRHQCLFEFCHLVNTARNQVFPPPHYRRRGSAARYRR